MKAARGRVLVAPVSFDRPRQCAGAEDRLLLLALRVSPHAVFRVISRGISRHSCEIGMSLAAVSLQEHPLVVPHDGQA